MKSELVSNFNVELFLTGFIKENKGLFDAITSDLLNIGCLSLNSNGVYGEIGITTSYRNDGSYRTGGTGLYVGLGGKSEFFNFNINLAIGYWKTYYDSIYNESPEINHSYFYPFTRLTIGPEKFGIVGVLGFKTGYPTYSIGLYTNFYKF